MLFKITIPCTHKYFCLKVLTDAESLSEIIPRVPCTRTKYVNLKRQCRRIKREEEDRTGKWMHNTSVRFSSCNSCTVCTMASGFCTQTEYFYTRIQIFRQGHAAHECITHCPIPQENVLNKRCRTDHEISIMVQTEFKLLIHAQIQYLKLELFNLYLSYLWVQLVFIAKILGRCA